MAVVCEQFSAWLAPHSLLASSLENLLHLEPLSGPVVTV